MRFGIYYSGGFDWTLNGEPIQNFLDLTTHVCLLAPSV
jgi:hypothetical protein